MSVSYLICVTSLTAYLDSFVEPWGPYTQGAAPYLDRAIEWARQTGLKVVIDLHGAPKSQNGFDHSGHKQAAPGWGDHDSVSYTLAALEVLEKKYATPKMQDVVVAIEFLNEPYLKKLDMATVKQFYRDAFNNLRMISNMTAMMHDGFYDPQWLNGFLTPQDGNSQGAVVDHHEYQIFDSGLLSMSIDQHVALVCKSVGHTLTRTAPQRLLICNGRSAITMVPISRLVSSRWNHTRHILTCLPSHRRMVRRPDRLCSSSQRLQGRLSHGRHIRQLSLRWFLHRKKWTHFLMVTGMEERCTPLH